jgi:Protein of unknown function (DUF1549)/Protein of unknown function (DUF1553)
MASNRRFLAGGFVMLVLAAGFFGLRAQDDTAQLPVTDPNCSYFTPKPSKTAGVAAMTIQVAAALPADAQGSAMPSAPGGSRTDSAQHPSGTIDKYIFDALSAANVAPAPPTTDYEFVRRIYLDLTGRIPTPDQVTNFVNDSSSDKRAKLIDSLIGSATWLDKWTVWFGDLYHNNSRNTQIPRYVPGVVAFNAYVHDSLAANKPYDQMARELISAKGADSYTQGELNFQVGSEIVNGPIQDTMDQKAADTFETFLGISHLNCLLCHNGRGHLDSLSMWGYYTTRQQAWGVASFFSRTRETRTPVSGATNNQPYYWSVLDNVPLQGQKASTDYQLNTTTGNRPTRAPVGGQSTIAPSYIFGGSGASPGDSYRTALGKFITSDFQFARATVNYMWEYFFSIGLVSPSNQFDPDRLDPDNPPSNCPPNVPCTLQASNPRLLNALAQDFVQSGYDLRALQREIVTSRAYQLSARYNGTWDVANQNLFARKLVRRLWAEEVHDAIAQSSGILPNYPGNFNSGGTQMSWGPVSYAMKFPETVNTPDGGGVVSQFLDAFLRGNRDDEDRRSDGSISQALDLMNDQTMVMNRVQSKNAASLIQQALKLTDDQMVDTLFLNVLSRYPTAAEKSTALGNLKSNRTQEAQNLLWSLYNKVDFVFNY